MNTRQNVKHVVGFVAGLGGAFLTGAAASRLISIMPNPLTRAVAHIGAMGLGVVVGNAAKAGTYEVIDSFSAIVEEINS